MNHFETDYLVVGAGAMGMAFADEILAKNPGERVLMVDKHARPGGHWNDAYPFVSLHQPAAYYGVNSEKLGSGGAALASGSEVLAYFERVARKWMVTDRFQYFPMCAYTEDGRFHSLVETDWEAQVTVRKKTVDATYMKVEVPSTRPPAYAVSEGVDLVPLGPEGSFESHICYGSKPVEDPATGVLQHYNELLTAAGPLSLAGLALGSE